jgi:nucleoside-diphosphate-sugar epimerase
MRVLVTGTEGYIGSHLAPALRERGHEVTGLDTGYYADGCLYDLSASPTATIRRDTREITLDDLRGFEAVVHLAELSNDPLGQLNPALTFRINHEASVRLARLSREAGVARFVYSSSCSVYCAGADAVRTETSAPEPQTAYAECKVLVERDVAALAAPGFTPTFLRNATAFGPSPRMRFDIVLNNLAGMAWTTHEIAMTSDGTPWRPLVHVLDICEAMACVLEAPRDAVHGEVFNVGSDEQNYRVREIAEIIAEVFPDCRLSFGTIGSDRRSYQVAFGKIRQHLPAFRCRRDARHGARELRELFDRIGLTRAMFESRHFTRLKQLEYLLAQSRLDSDLRWIAS